MGSFRGFLSMVDRLLAFKKKEIAQIKESNTASSYRTYSDIHTDNSIRKIQLHGNQDEILKVLLYVRHQAVQFQKEKIEFHQLTAHWSLAYACSQPPEPWEIYQVPSLIPSIPSTDFFKNHPSEIREAIRPYATWDLLKVHAVEKLALEAAMTDEEFKAHGSTGPTYYDFQTKRWTSVDVPGIRWFDGRESLMQTKEEFQSRVEGRLSKLRRLVKDNPTPRRLEELAGYEKYVSGPFKENLRRFIAKKKVERSWLTKLDATKNFEKTLFSILRQAENNVRSAHGVPAVGESWVSEVELLCRLRDLFPNLEIFAHGKPHWLGRQHLDIWIPSMSVAIEYHGLQHFQSVDFFGGDEAFQLSHQRDQRKRALCVKNGVRLIEIAYDDEYDDVNLKQLIIG